MKENKLISEFMGMNYGDPNDNSVMIQMTPQGNEVVPINSMEYHSSWDWLMPVVEKINNTGRFEVNIGYGHCYISDGEDKLTLSLQGKSTFNAIYKSVIEFIKWYNEQDRFICGVCGEHVNEYTYNEDKDVDECNNCK